MEHGLLLLLSSPWLGLRAQHQAVGGGSCVWQCIPPVHCTQLPLSHRKGGTKAEWSCWSRYLTNNFTGRDPKGCICRISMWGSRCLPQPVVYIPHQSKEEPVLSDELGGCISVCTYWGWHWLGIFWAVGIDEPKSKIICLAHCLPIWSLGQGWGPWKRTGLFWSESTEDFDIMQCLSRIWNFFFQLSLIINLFIHAGG